MLTERTLPSRSFQERRNQSVPFSWTIEPAKNRSLFLSAGQTIFPRFCNAPRYSGNDDRDLNRQVIRRFLKIRYETLTEKFFLVLRYGAAIKNDASIISSQITNPVFHELMSRFVTHFRAVFRQYLSTPFLKYITAIHRTLIGRE